MKKGVDSSIFWNPEKVISHDCLLNFILGERGVGKSFSMTKFVIDDFLRHGHEFVYLRRYKTELDTSVPKFFDAIRNENVYGEDFELKVKKSSKMSELVVDGRTAGYAVALSTANILKSTSFAKVKNIVFDEFIIDRGAYHYLPNEVEKMLDIIETIARLRNVRVFFLGNSLTISNPYFNYFDIFVPRDCEYRTFKDGLILVNYIKNQKYRDVKKNTKFGRLIAGTDYGNYAIENQFLRDNESFIEKRHEDGINWNVVNLFGRTYGVWIGKQSRKIYVESSYDKRNRRVYSTDEYNHDENTLLLCARKDWFKIVAENYKIGNVRFENQRCKEDCMKLLRKILI